MLLKLDKYIFPVVFLFSLGVGLSSAPVVEQEYPMNQSYYEGNLDWNFTSYDDSNSSFSVWGWQDDVLVYESLIFVNNTHENIDHSLLDQSLGTHNMTILAQDNGDETVNETIYRISQYDYNVGYEQFVLETTNNDYNITIPYDSDLIDNITSDLIFNGTNYTTNTIASNTTHFIFNRSVFMPLININNTEITFYFANRIEYSNGTTLYENTSDYTSNITYAYWLNSFSSDASYYLEGDDVELSMYVGDTLGLANLTVNFTILHNNSYNLTYQVSSYTTVGNYNLYERDVSSGHSIDYNETKTIYGNLTVTYGNQTKILGSEDTIDVYRMFISNCTGISNTSTLLVSFYDEKDFSVVNGSIDVLLFTLYNDDVEESYSFVELTENETFIYCLYPSWGTLNATVYMEYKNSASQKRPYYLINTELTDSISSLDAFILNNTYSDYTNLYFYDENSDNLDGYYVRILKFNPNINVWQTLFIGLTDTSGIFTTYLEPIIQPYRFYVTDDSGSIIYRTESEVIPCLTGTCPPYEKHVYTTGSSGDYVNLWNIEYSYDFDESTRTVSIEISDISGLSDEIWIRIDRVLDFNITEGYINQTFSSSTAYFNQVLPNTTEEYIVNVEVRQNEAYYSIISESVIMETVMRLGLMGVIISILIIIGLGVAGINIAGVPGLIIGGIAGLSLSVLFKLVPMPLVGFYSIVFVLLIVLIEVLRGS